MLGMRSSQTPSIQPTNAGGLEDAYRIPASFLHDVRRMASTDGGVVSELRGRLLAIEHALDAGQYTPGRGPRSFEAFVLARVRYGRRSRRM